MCNIMSFNEMQRYTNANFKEKNVYSPRQRFCQVFTSSETWGSGVGEGSELTAWSSTAAGTVATAVEGPGRVA